MPKVALLDDSGMLKGFRVVSKPKAVQTAAQVPVPDDCDLVPGRYRWDADRGAFLPTGKATAAAAPTDALRAIWLGFRALKEQGIVLPEETLAWMASYAKTFDAQG